MSELDLKRVRRELDECDFAQTDKLARAMLIELDATRDFLRVVTRERDHAQLVEVPDANDQRDDALELLRDVTRPICCDCGCMLTGVVDLDSDKPPHCTDCSVEHDQEVEWQNETRPGLLRRIDAALKDVE